MYSTAGDTRVKALAGIGATVLMALAWVTHHFGIAVWVLLGALAVRYVLYLLGDVKTRNPFVTLALYLGTFLLAHISLPQVLAGHVSWTIVQAIVIAAAVYELRGLVSDLGMLKLPPNESTQVKTDLQDIRAMLSQVASMIQAQPSNAPQSTITQQGTESGGKT